MTTSDWIQASAAVLTGLTLIANGVLAYFAFRSLRATLATVQQQRDAARLVAFISRKQLVMQSNAVALDDQKNLDIVARLLYPEDLAKGVDPRTRWVTFNLLNCAEVGWAATLLNHDTAKGAQRAYMHHLRRLLKNPEVQESLRVGGYSPDFVDHCRREIPEFDAYMKSHEPA